MHPRDVELIVATVQVFLGLVVTAVSTWVGVLLMTVGLIRVGARIVGGHRRRRRRQAAQLRTPLLLDPRVARLALVETVTAEQDLQSSGENVCLVATSRGVVELDAVWSRAHTARVARRRRDLTKQPSDVALLAGAIVVRGRALIKFDAPHGGWRPHPMVVPLRTVDREHHVLVDDVGRGDPRWNFTAEYTLTGIVEGDPAPVWVTPSLAPGSGGRALDLEVQWQLGDPSDPYHLPAQVPVAKEIERLRLVVPAAWGEVSNVSGADQVTVSAPHLGTQVIEWKRPAGVEKSSRGRCHLSVSFDRPLIGPAEPAPRIDGELEMIFEQALSGAERVFVHAAGGARRQDGAAQNATVRTRVEVALSLDLGSLRHQEIRAVPDKRRDGDQSRDEERVFPDVAPDHHTVALLTDQLSEQGYYVKRVVENPAQPGRAPGVLSRFWDIAGRRYDGVHPTDFHVVLTGEQAQPGSGEPSTTSVRLTVRGTVTNQDMEQRILDEHDELWSRVDSSITAHAAAGVRTTGVPVGAAGAEVDRLRQVAVTVRGRLRDLDRDGSSSPGIAPLITLLDEEFGLDGRSA